MLTLLFLSTICGLTLLEIAAYLAFGGTIKQNARRAVAAGLAVGGVILFIQVFSLVLTVLGI